MVNIGFDRKRLPLFAAVLIIALLLVYAGSLLTWRTEAAEQETDPAGKKVINVAGQGTVYATPDIAYITLGVVTEDKEAKDAQQKNADAMAAVVAKLKEAGIKDADIKTVNYSISPKYDYQSNTGSSKIIGYTASNSVQVTIRDVSKAGSIIDTAASSGVNTSGSISFGLSDYEKHYNEALKKAVEVARQRGKTIADSMGLTLKSPLSISENGANEPVYRPTVYYDEAKLAVAAATPVEAGSLTVTAAVNITYEY